MSRAASVGALGHRDDHMEYVNVLTHLGLDLGEIGPRWTTDDLRAVMTRRLETAWARRSGSVGVATVESDVGSEVYQELLASFLQYLPLQLAELRNAAGVGDVPAARYVAHQLMGTAPSFGAVHLDELARRLLLVGKEQGGQLQSFVDEIDNEVVLLQAVLGPYAMRT